MTPRVLVFVLHLHGRPTAESLFTLARATALAGRVDALVTGDSVDRVAGAVAESGVERVLVADGAAFADARPQPCVDAVAALVESEGYDTVLFPGSTFALNVAAGAAARLEAGVNWGLDDVRLAAGELVGTRRALDDSVEVEVGWTTPVRLAVLRGTAARAAPGGPCAGGPCGIQRVRVELRDWSTKLDVLETTLAPADGARLEQAAVVVAGGRGLGPGGVALLEELAEALGGAVGATMPAVDAGWYPRAAQVGQSGSTVKPRVYIACGISGAMQHKVGMEGSETIVAVNTDPAAPIFRFCDVGVVADAHEFVPRLLALVRARTRGA